MATQGQMSYLTGETPAVEIDSDSSGLLDDAETRKLVHELGIKGED